MRMLRLLMGIGYWLLLTVLLLAPNPAALLGMHRFRIFPWGDSGVHFTAFVILTLMIYAAQWPRSPGWLLTALLFVYAVVAETLQAFIPPRAVEVRDYIENTLGIVIGTGLYWLIQGALQARCAKRQTADQPRTQAPLRGEPDVAGSVASPPS